MIVTRQLRFQGYSDDTFACEGPGIDVDHDNCANGEPIRMLVEADGKAMVVSGQYAPAGTGGWLIGVAPYDDPRGDDVPIPDWPMWIGRGERPYSPMLSVETPDDVKVTLLEDDDDD